MTDNIFPSSMDEAELDELLHVLSPERVRSYRRAANGHPREAIELHVWNTLVSGAFYGPLQTVEIALRNAIHNRLSRSRGNLWFQSHEVLLRRELDRVDEARRKLRRKRPSSAQLVPELGFGFWVGLLDRRYDVLWRTELHRAFAPGAARSELHKELVKLRDLRNRIAHHEPVHSLPLDEHHESLLWVLEMLSPVAARWVSSHSRVPDILAAPDRRTERF